MRHDAAVVDINDRRTSVGAESSRGGQPYDPRDSRFRGMTGGTVTALAAAARAAARTAASALQASHDLFKSGNNVIIEISATDMLTLVNTQISELSETDVKFQ